MSSSVPEGQKTSFFENLFGSATFQDNATRSQVLFRDLVGDVFRLADGESNNRERRIRCSASSELATIRDKQVTDIVSLTPLITNTVVGTRA